MVAKNMRACIPGLKLCPPGGLHHQRKTRQLEKGNWGTRPQDQGARTGKEEEANIYWEPFAQSLFVLQYWHCNCTYSVWPAIQEWPNWSFGLSLCTFLYSFIHLCVNPVSLIRNVHLFILASREQRQPIECSRKEMQSVMLKDMLEDSMSCDICPNGIWASSRRVN